MKYLDVKQLLHKHKGWFGHKPKEKSLIQYTTKNPTIISLNVEPYYQLNLLVFKKRNMANNFKRFMLSQRKVNIEPQEFKSISCRRFSFYVESQTHHLIITVRKYFIIAIFWGAKELICIDLILMLDAQHV